MFILIWILWYFEMLKEILLYILNVYIYNFLLYLMFIIIWDKIWKSLKLLREIMKEYAKFNLNVIKLCIKNSLIRSKNIERCWEKEFQLQNSGCGY
jgi:hypothetical protein